MSKIKNSVYGLALGDAIGYRTEFSTYSRAVSEYLDENLTEETDDKLLVTDDTQMSLYLLDGFLNAWEDNPTYTGNSEHYIEEIANNFLIWLHDGDNNRAPGVACIESLMSLETHFKNNPSSKDYYYGGSGRKNSKGSGTVMRSPWIGLLNAKGALHDDELEDFCNKQSSITHQHPTALNASYLCALMTSEIYRGNIAFGELNDWALDYTFRQVGFGWQELTEAFARKQYLPENYTTSALSEFDPSIVFGQSGTAENVLATAVNMIDYFHDDPVQVLRRCMFTSGDSDTIGAVAGGMLGAGFEEDIWNGIKHLVEEKYVFILNDAICFLENL